MKSLKIFFLTALVAVASMFTACTEDHEWSAGEQVTGAQVYFADGVETNVTVEAETSSFEVTVMRGNVDEAATVPLKVAVSAANVDEEADPINYAELFTVPSNVSFGAGKDSAKFTVSFDRASLEDGQTYTLTFSINDAGAVTPYGYDKQTWTLVVPEPYVLLGTGLYRDDLVASIFNIGGFPEYQVEIYENLNTPGFIYLKNPYGEAFPVNASNFHPYEEDVYFAIDISNPDAVVIPEQPLGLSVDNYGDIWVRMYLDNVGTYKDGIISFGPETMEQAMTLYQGGSYDYLWGCANGMSRLVMPGVVLTDFSLELAYGGFRVAEDNETIYPIARAAYGADVAEIQYAFVAGDITKDAEALNAALNGIEDGSVVSNKVPVTIAGEDEETGEPILEMTLESVEGVEPGVLTVIAIPYSADGEAQYEDLAFTSFYVQGVGATEAPEVDLELEWMPFSVGMPDYASSYPDHSTWYCEMYGSEIKAMKYYLNTTAAIDGVLAQGATLEDIIAAYGKEYDPSYINADGWDYIFFTEMPAETSFTLIVWAENTYGNTVTLTASGATAAAPSAKKGNAKLSWDHINGRQIAFNPNKGISFSTIK
ncbi:MAG: DUF1735 domain-containing protein [Alistipes sp.]|nr:DUF1735 domain-containing protein [Alistipes sp.]